MGYGPLPGRHRHRLPDRGKRLHDERPCGQQRGTHLHLHVRGFPQIPARVKFIAHDADLALLEADDPKPFKGIRPFEFSKNLPHLEDEVRVIGYPIGGNRLSVTRGVVSRIDFTTYAHPATRNT